MIDISRMKFKFYLCTLLFPSTRSAFTLKKYYRCAVYKMQIRYRSITIFFCYLHINLIIILIALTLPWIRNLLNIIFKQIYIFFIKKGNYLVWCSAFSPLKNPFPITKRYKKSPITFIQTSYQAQIEYSTATFEKKKKQIIKKWRVTSCQCQNARQIARPIDVLGSLLVLFSFRGTGTT